MFDLKFWISVIAVCIAMQLYKYIYMRLFNNGTLSIDRSNPVKDVYQIKVNDLDSIAKKRYIILKVDNDADLSQK